MMVYLVTVSQGISMLKMQGYYLCNIQVENIVVM